MNDQLTLRLQAPPGAPPTMLRVQADHRVLRAECDWTLSGHTYQSSNGWEIRKEWVARERDGWAAFAPDGIAEWWGPDPITVMERAEGQR